MHLLVSLARRFSRSHARSHARSDAAHPAAALPFVLPVLPLCVLVLGVASSLPSQACVRPLVAGAGHPLANPPGHVVTYTDGYVTDGAMVLPATPPPSCGWPLVVYVHRLGGTQLEEPALRQFLAAQGYAVWSYGVRGQSSGLFLHPENAAHPHRGSTLWGPIERQDLAEQILFVAGEPAFAGVVDATRVAVLGPSQGGAHAWAAAAMSGRTLTVPGRSPVVMPQIRCVAAIDYVAESVLDWLRDESMWSMWFVNNITDDIVHIASAYELDPTMWSDAAAAFRAQDPSALLAIWDAEGRRFDAQLATSQVPVLHSQAYHDVINSPLPSLQLLQNSTAPRRVLMSTIGHNTPNNTAERTYRDQTILRWLHRYLWEEHNAVDVEPPDVMAELPLDAASRTDAGHLWARQHGDDPLVAQQAQRHYLYDNGTLQDVQPGQVLASSVIDHVLVDPSYTATSFLVSGSNRSLPAVLAAIPLSEHEYATAPLQVETSLVAAPTVHLHVTPQQAEWMVAALLSIELPQAAPFNGERVMLSSWAKKRVDSVPGVAEVLEFQLPPVHTRIPPGARVVLTLRNHWLREAPMTRALEAAPMFTPFQIAIGHGDPVDGSWIDLPLAAPKPVLLCGEQSLDLQTLPPLELTMRGGLDKAGKAYFVSMSVSGQVPGTVFLNTVLPMNTDWMSVFVAGAFNQPELTGFLGSLDAVTGEATAIMDLSAIAPLDPGLTGLRITFAGFVWDAFFGRTGTATNAVDVFLR